MDKLERINVPLGEFRNNISKFVRLAQTGVVVNITKHGKVTASVISAEDLRRMEALIEDLWKREEKAARHEEEGQAAKAKELRKENDEIGKLVKRALHQAVEGNSTLLHDMARKYLGL